MLPFWHALDLQMNKHMQKEKKEEVNEWSMMYQKDAFQWITLYYDVW